ncbi:MAG: SUMF1/EgtB/PvdO family nonheme iron enzyme [Prosthecobacter sp.]|jgi:formylglycine-generating enzyme required for sulfatase activity|uniref:bifunctional serine/threonine-protein kinase/formylglycine-generating enzyme family protein n=1 Tax=Prosthecobacter sp. TaxID=1965333 RepID=UPI0019E2CF53|nr:bifunctional serine/threonine-protein kinase/formylglycine-generating enzyme family protein [Prosthecobacter sp.]MBE2285193.1 SUMF1/EgtB/PvdO family nonheme iron enzyme [Prosthecobacter sp.]
MSSSIPASTPGKPWQPPAPEDLAPELPQYEILGLLGRGGMGAVYKARQKSLNREVAIKILPPMAEEDGTMHYAERFIAEAQAMARLEHQNIVAVYDAGQTPGGLLYFVMQYVQGTDVSQMIRSAGRLPPEHAYAITAHVCEALAYAHKNGIIHRDIKPANIMVDMEGRVKVADFGLAKAVDAQTGFTQSNMAVGTPDFVAPEALIPGMPVDGRADLYAVGVMLYQMLTGNIPRGAWQPASVMAPGTDPRFDQIIVKAMAYDREQRHHSATELRQHLDSILMPAVAAPDLQQYSSAQMPKQAAPQASRSGVATARPAAAAPKPDGRAKATPVLPPKSRTPLFIGIGAAAAIGIGAFVMFSGGRAVSPKPPPGVVGDSAPTAKPQTLAGSATAPVKPNEPPKAAPTPIVVAKVPEPAKAEPPKLASAVPQMEETKPAAPAMPDRALVSTPAPVPAPASSAVPSSPSLPISSSPPSALDQRLAGLDASFQAAVERDANTAFKASIAALDKLYLTALDRALATASKGGKLEEALALREEKQRIEKGEGVPSEVDESTQVPGKVPDTLKTLRKTYRSTSAQHEATKAKAMQPLYDKYDQALAAVQTELTQAQKLDDALRVKTVREQIAATRGGGQANTAATSSAITSTSSVAVVSSSSSGDWLSAARKRGGPLKLWGGTEPGQNIPVPAKAAKYDDYVSLNMMNLMKRVLFATRRDGNVVALDLTDFPKIEVEELRDTMALNAGDIASFVAKSGKVLRADGYEVFDPKMVRKALGVAHSYKGGVVFSGEGDLESFGGFDNKELEMPPADLLKGLRIVAGGAIDGSLVFLTQDGKVVGWNGRAKKPLEFGRLNNSTVLEMAVCDGLGFLTSEGKILMCDHNGLFGNGGFAALGTEALKGQSGPFVRVQGTIRFGAVQHEDGSWLGWGEAATLNDKVKSLGSVLDLDGAYQIEANSKQVQSMTLAWIELPSGAKPGAATKPAPPTPTPPVAPASGSTLAATKDKPFTNSLGMKFVPVPGTDVLMCIHETRKIDYAAFAMANTNVKSDWKSPNENGLPVSDADDHPVVMVDWNSAVAFCTWLSLKEGITYRLATDREWSYAVGIGQDEDKAARSKGSDRPPRQLYPWGDKWPPPKNSGNYADSSLKQKMSINSVIQDYDDGYAATAPVMRFKENQLGLYDLGGNVWEWCLDSQDPAKAKLNLRGCSWKDAGNLHSATRRLEAPDFKHVHVGFRVVLDTRAPASPNGAATKPVTPTPAPAPAPATAAKSDFTNSLGMKFVKVPGTKVLFCIHETRKGDYAKYAAETPGVDDKWKKAEFGNPPTVPGDDHPVVMVNWEEANHFCAWLSTKEGRRFRLPTDNEWSFAVGIGRDEKNKATPQDLNSKVMEEWPWGKKWPPPQAVGNYSDSARSAKEPGALVIPNYTDGHAYTAPVMSFSPNRLGIYDLGGNVQEWCGDWFNDAKIDRVVRGGAWDQVLRAATWSSHRFHPQDGISTPVTRDNRFGFRIVLETNE